VGKTIAKIHMEKRMIIILKRVRAIKSLSEERVFLQQRRALREIIYLLAM